MTLNLLLISLQMNGSERFCDFALPDLLSCYVLSRFLPFAFCHLSASVNLIRSRSTSSTKSSVVSWADRSPPRHTQMTLFQFSQRVFRSHKDVEARVYCPSHDQHFAIRCDLQRCIKAKRSIARPQCKTCCVQVIVPPLILQDVRFPFADIVTSDVTTCTTLSGSRSVHTQESITCTCVSRKTLTTCDPF